MILSEAAMKTLCQEIYVVTAQKVYGQQGVDGLFSILETARELYRHIEPTRIKGTVIIFRPMTDDALPAGANGQLCGDFDVVAPRAVNGIIIEIREDGSRYLHSSGSMQAADLARHSVVYEYQDSSEQFFVGDECKRLIKLIPTAASQFAVPTFFTLSEALLQYAQAHVRYSKCPELEKAWADPNRLLFKPRPEEQMRRSLTFFLKVRLGASYEVRPEQVMDESHPVDIKVTFTPAKRLMIIEIKWLGDSLNERGEIGTTHRDARAKAGAKQLADYLDQNKEQAPFHVSQGYYVIIDARRKGITETSTTISRDDGLHYADKEIVFDPEFNRIREDFDPPYRMFVEPICLP